MSKGSRNRTTDHKSYSDSPYWKNKIQDPYIKELKLCQKDDDTECAHVMADRILCNFLIELGYSDAVEEYQKVDKWFS